MHTEKGLIRLFELKHIIVVVWYMYRYTVLRTSTSRCNRVIASSVLLVVGLPVPYSCMCKLATDVLESSTSSSEKV